MTEDIVRVLRIIEYVGPRSQVERTIAHSIHGTKSLGEDYSIRAATIGTYPDILDEETTTVAIALHEAPEQK